MRRGFGVRARAFGVKAIRRTALVGLVLVSAVSASRGWDPPLALAVTGTWSATGSMATPRLQHTATLLRGGKVLAAGGGCCLATAELYDPVTGTWSATGGMTTPRALHTATLLPSGKVLVAGGCCAEHASAELFDPTGTPAPTCGLTRSGTDAHGHAFLAITVQDPNSGLLLVKVTESTNATVAVPTFVVGTTSPQIVVATKTDQTKTSRVALQVTNVAREVTNCDPILTEVGRDGPHGAPRAETFRHVAQGESRVTIVNNTPGLTRLKLAVDGHVFEMTGLMDGETRLVDVSSAMRRGNNTITLVAQAKSDGTANVLIADK
jgi:hypothetical protein